MSEIFFKRKRGAPFRFSETEREKLNAVTAAEAEAQAIADVDNPPLTEQQLNRMILARQVRRVREKTGLSQPEFAARFHIGLGRLRDYEQGRSEPDIVVRVFLQIILEDPATADRLIALVAAPSSSRIVAP
jgi:putative transcriptional regulator